MAFRPNSSMRVLIATDTWHPQVNGVVRSIEQMVLHAEQFGATIAIIEPGQFRSLSLPTYPEIRLGLARPAVIARRIAAFRPTHIHIATEGPIGFASRWVCLRHGFPYSTSYHTRFPEYVSARLPIPESWVYRLLLRFHNAAGAMMVATAALRTELDQRGFKNIRLWSRGVDGTVFNPHKRGVLDAERPITLYVGRLAVEKDLPAFLSLDLPGTKFVVGDGPARQALERRFPQARFLGVLEGERLAQVYASADLFVFPSRTDTFGMVLLEALASGLPIAAFPVAGPRDVLTDSGCGILDNDLRMAALRALEIPRARCRVFAERFRWQESAREFFEGVLAANGSRSIDPASLAR